MKFSQSLRFKRCLFGSSALLFVLFVAQFLGGGATATVLFLLLLPMVAIFLWLLNGIENEITRGKTS